MEADDAPAWGMGSADELPTTTTSVEEGEGEAMDVVVRPSQMDDISSCTTPGPAYLAFASSPNKRKRPPAKLAIATEPFRSTHRAQLSLEKHDGTFSIHPSRISPQNLVVQKSKSVLFASSSLIPSPIQCMCANAKTLKKSARPSPRDVSSFFFVRVLFPATQRWRCWPSSRRGGPAAGA
jgi:hypothetical protein